MSKIDKIAHQAGPTASPVPAKAYEPTARELEAVKAYYAHHRERKNPAPRVKLTVVGKVGNLDLDHPDPNLGATLLGQALGSADSEFVAGLISQLANAGSKAGKVDEADLNFMLSVIKSIEPKDQVEVMLSAQMAVVHIATMTFARRLANVDNIPAAGQRRERLQQADADLRGSGRGAEALPHRRRAEGHRPARQRQRGRPGHRRQRHPPGGGGVAKTEDQPHASDPDPCPTLRRSDAEPYRSGAGSRANRPP